MRTDELSASELVVTSAFSKMVASTITYPHEVVRSYMHVTGVFRGHAHSGGWGVFAWTAREQQVGMFAVGGLIE